MRLHHRPGMTGVLVISFLAVGPNAASGAKLAAVDLKLQEAKQLAEQGQYENALQVFQEVAALAPRTPQGQQAMVRAGDCLDKLTRKPEAIAQYDNAITSGAKPYWTQTALLAKARLCLELGQTDAALQTAERLRLEFPDSELAIDALDVEGPISGLSVAQIEALKAKEHLALQKLQEVRNLLDKSGQNDQQVLDGIKYLETECPLAPATLAAQPTKGFILLRQNRPIDAVQVYTAILNKVAPVVPETKLVAPDTKLAREVRNRLGEAVMLSAEMSFSRKVENKPSSEETKTWQAVRDLCRQVLKMGRSSEQLADARMWLVAIELIEGNYPRTDRVARVYLELYSGDAKLKKFPEQVLTIRLLAAEAARRSRNFDRALELNERVKRQFSRLSEDQRRSPKIAELLRRAYFQAFRTLCGMKADPATIQRTAEEVIARFPGSRHADAVRKDLVRLASQPAP